jgi:hypothetical protein
MNELVYVCGGDDRRDTYMQVRCKHIGTCATAGVVDPTSIRFPAHCSSRPNSHGPSTLFCCRHPLPSSGQKLPPIHKGGRTIVVVKSFGRSFLPFHFVDVGTGIGKLRPFSLGLGSGTPVSPPPNPKPKGNSSRLQRIGTQVPLEGPEEEQNVFSRH